MKNLPVVICIFVICMGFSSAGGETAASFLDLIRSGDEKKVMSALEAGAPVHARNRYGETPLMLASEKGNAKIVEALIKAGAVVNVKRKNGVTALMMAAERGHVDTAKALLKASAEIDAQSANGNSALLWAAMRGHYDMVKLLVEKGADINRKNKSGYTAAELAGKWRRGRIVQFLRELELKKIAPVENKKQKAVTKEERDTEENEDE
ncbi:MAG TPA: ankyrin repeat domain-containing protein [Spirochaetota bacterium]|nr:ankyrin repeat domain-containing protein [Spirochaetota bacterium]